MTGGSHFYAQIRRTLLTLQSQKSTHHAARPAIKSWLPLTFPRNTSDDTPRNHHRHHRRILSQRPKVPQTTARPAQSRPDKNLRLRYEHKPRVQGKASEVPLHRLCSTDLRQAQWPASICSVASNHNHHGRIRACPNHCSWDCSENKRRSSNRQGGYGLDSDSEVKRVGFEDSRTRTPRLCLSAGCVLCEVVCQRGG